MQIKTTIGYRLTLARMADIKKSTNHKCWRGYGEKGGNFFFFFVFLPFLGPLLWDMEVSRLGVESEL